MIYHLTYDDQEIAMVEIRDSEASRAAIKEMVQFWSGWQQALHLARGDYTDCWLRKLARFIVISGFEPCNEEGWYPLDGSKDIKLLSLTPWEIDESRIDVWEDDV